MTSKKEFKEAWDSHIGDFSRLGWSVSKEEFERIKEIQAELRAIVEKASEKMSD